MNGPGPRRGPVRPVPVRGRSTFAALGATRPVREGPVRIRHVPGPQWPPGVAYAISRRAGTAVVRNRIRRRLREAVARSGELAAGWYLVGAGPEAAAMPFEELQRCLDRALHRARAQSAGARSTPARSTPARNRCSEVSS